MSLRDRFRFRCYGCGNTAPLEPHFMACPACGEPFSIEATAQVNASLFETPPRSLWSYRELLPVDLDDSIVSLNEGATPLTDAPRLAKSIGAGQVLLKVETGNPTGSFKDRQVSVGISHAREIGSDTVAVVSSGNVACAAAAFAARAGMRAVLFMHGMAGAGKTAQAASYGPTVVRVASPSAGDVFKLCVEACDTFGWYHLSTAGMYNPYNVEGAKTIAYEMFCQTHGDLPDWIVAAVGGGGLLGGIWRGLLDLKRLGLISKLPRLAGMQATGCAPLKKAIDNNTPFLETLKDPWPNPKTIAGGIADDIIFDGHTVLPAIRTTNGAAIAIDDDAILAGELELARSEGILCEPTCAGVIAAMRHLPDITSSTRIACIVTGTGIKDLDAIRDHVAKPHDIDPSLESLKRAVGLP
ncbi:MAG: threonine synthase [Candidatus Hydrogenedentota bacterium]